MLASAEHDAELLQRASTAEAQRRRRHGRRVLALQTLFGALLLLGWAAASGRLVDRMFLSDPASVVQALIRIIGNGTLWWHLQATLLEMVLGYGVGVTVGIAAAVLVAALPLGAPIAQPMMLAGYATPKVALAPLIIVWFGIGLLPKVVLGASLVFFIVYFNTLAGIGAVAPGMLTVVEVMGAGRAGLFRKVLLPGAAPHIFTAMRATLPAALIGAIIGEFVSSNRGIGYLIAAASSRFDTATVFAAIASLLVFVLALNTLVSMLERHVLRWRPAAPVIGHA
jgi:NitT/TauT family transport system permease protein